MTIDKFHYGLLNYHNTLNLGDEIQSIAARRFLPKVDYLIDRDQLANFEPEDNKKIKLICNGWYSHNPENWPPSKSIYPLLASIHISGSEAQNSKLSARKIMLSDPMIEYLKSYGPVGARDLQTLELLQEKNIPSYFSGCLTLTLQKKGLEKQSDLIVLNDVPDEVVSFIRKKTNKKILLVNYDINNYNSMERFKEAEHLLELYERASCVITTRLHAALPSLALGTPAFLLDIAPDQYRFSGLNQFVRHDTIPNFLKRDLFDFNNPEPNSKQYLNTASQLEKTVNDFIQRTDVEFPVIPDMLEARLNTVTTSYLALKEETQKLKQNIKSTRWLGKQFLRRIIKK